MATLSLVGKQVWSNGDSIMAPTNSWLRQLVVAAGGSLANYSTVANGGKGFTPGFGGQYSTLEEIPPNATNRFAYAFINITANDIQAGTTWVAYGEYMEQYLSHMLHVKGWKGEQIIFSNPYWRSPNAGDVDPAAVYSPTMFVDYNREIRRICGKYGVIYGNPFDYVAAHPEFQSYFGSLHPVEGTELSGHTILRDFYLNVQEYTPATPVVEDAKLQRRGYTFTATEATILTNSGLTTATVTVLYETANPLNAYVPGRSGNLLTTLTPGTRYTIVPVYKATLDLNVLRLPGPDARPATFSGTSEAQAYVAASGRGASQQAIAAFVATLKLYNLWDRCLGFWLLSGDYGAAKYNLKNPQDTDAAGRLTQVGGTFGPTGWTGGGGSSVLKTGLYLANTNQSGVFYVGTDNAAVSATFDIGTPESYLSVNYDGRIIGHWNGPNGYPGYRGPGTRFYLSGDNTHQTTWVGERTANKFASVGTPPSADNELTIGNATSLTQGSTRTIRSAGYFTGLEDDEVIYLDRAIAALEAGTTFVPLAALDLPVLASGAALPAGHMNALVAKINQLIEVAAV